MAKSKKEAGLIGQLKEAIRTSGKTLYRIGKDSSVGTDSLYRFMSGERGLSLDAVDRIFESLRLKIVREEGEQAEPSEQPPKKRQARKEK